MPTKRLKSSARRAPAHHTISSLATRVKILELDFSEMRGDVKNLAEDMHALTRVLSSVSDRSIRGEKILFTMQGGQRRMAKAMTQVLEALRLRSVGLLDAKDEELEAEARQAEHQADSDEEDGEEIPDPP